MTNLAFFVILSHWSAVSPLHSYPSPPRHLIQWVSALSQLRSYLGGNGLFESFQSGFCRIHSTETAILHVVNDILLSMDSGSMNISILLHLSSAFAMIYLSCFFFISLVQLFHGSFPIPATERFLSLYKGINPPLLHWHRVFLKVPFSALYCSSNLTASLLTINKQQIRKSGVWGKSCN